ncbi:hypothetical protein EXU57_23475 [Segetibacter sp. 3557_3]|uniref:hypothetical protein n=1 Tax=Segetibacter sp. 3557_3 TaxID=2547429 RepID=UPI001058DFF9|nr:hypothetical protein [Segetibacter sp. 3557_3]TDH18426.1 hypothetical protein EXU57_23475 [Segetibacter sp. 3557_3]
MQVLSPATFSHRWRCCLAPAGVVTCNFRSPLEVLSLPLQVLSLALARVVTSDFHPPLQVLSLALAGVVTCNFTRPCRCCLSAFAGVVTCNFLPSLEVLSRPCRCCHLQLSITPGGIVAPLAGVVTCNFRSPLEVLSLPLQVLSLALARVVTSNIAGLCRCCLAPAGVVTPIFP